MLLLVPLESVRRELGLREVAHGVEDGGALLGGQRRRFGSSLFVHRDRRWSATSCRLLSCRHWHDGRFSLDVQVYLRNSEVRDDDRSAHRSERFTGRHRRSLGKESARPRALLPRLRTPMPSLSPAPRPVAAPRPRDRSGGCRLRSRARAGHRGIRSGRTRSDRVLRRRRGVVAQPDRLVRDGSVRPVRRGDRDGLRGPAVRRECFGGQRRVLDYSDPTAPEPSSTSFAAGVANSVAVRPRRPRGRSPSRRPSRPTRARSSSSTRMPPTTAYARPRAASPSARCPTW